MKALRLNADYESELFFGKPAPPLINQSLEFFIFFLTDRPLYSQKKYPEDYLAYVEKKTGRRPVIQSSGAFENWWGLLQDVEREKWWNSKVTSTEIIRKQGWCQDTYLIRSAADLPDLDWSKKYLMKDPFGMSGQKFQVIQEKPVIKSYPVILEPFFERKFDFSQYVFPDGNVITYENQVDEKFQYKGTTFTTDVCRPEDLSFYDLVSVDEWKEYLKRTEVIREFYSRFPNEIGYSIDSFVYETNGVLKIRTLSEINYRRTMGRMAYELGSRYFKDFSRCTLQLIKPTPGQALWRKYQDDENFLVLSPGDTRFEVVLLSDT